MLLLTFVYWISEAEFHIAQLVSHYDAEARPEFLMLSCLYLFSVRIIGIMYHFHLEMSF